MHDNFCKNQQCLHLHQLMKKLSNVRDRLIVKAGWGGGAAVGELVQIRGTRSKKCVLQI